MTRRDYFVIAQAVASIENHGARLDACRALAKALKADNERFNEEKFYLAAKVSYSG